MTSFSSNVEIFEDKSDGAPFEGPEKLLEIWFAPSEAYLEKHGDPEGLRRVTRKTWEDMLDIVCCKVLSVIEGDDVDAYLLSESSMFVWPHKLILKTCGTTTLLLGLERLLEIAREQCGFSTSYRCFYSRKAFMFPERQKGPHRHWDEEVKHLDGIFGKGNGSAYVVGRMNGDHWLLYLTAPKDPSFQKQLLQAAVHDGSEASAVPALDVTSAKKLDLASSNDEMQLQASTSSSPASELPKVVSPPDQTLEILMTHLDPEACKAFYYPEPTHEQIELSLSPGSNVDLRQKGHEQGTRLTQVLGIDELLPQATVDSFLFEPCGYSANIVREDRYATIHVTPEQDFSYASFECNVDFRTPHGQALASSNGGATHSSSSILHSLIARVLNVFRPAKFSISLFISEEETTGLGDEVKTPETRTLLDPNVAKGYNRTDRILYEFDGYNLLFATFEKTGSCTS